MRSISFIKIAGWMVLCLFAATFALSFFVPIYTDEITVKIARAHVILNGFQLISLFPQCGDAPFALPIPWTWIPSLLIDGLIYGNATGPISLRIVGMLMFVVWLGMVEWFMRRNLKAAINFQTIMVGLISLISLGVLPFLLVLNRPEQVLLVGITFISLLPLTIAKVQPQSDWGWALLAVIFCLVVSYIFSNHPKAFFFIPLLIVSALYLWVASKRVWVGTILLGGLGVICYESLSFWNQRMYCPEAPLLDVILKSHSLSIGLLFTSPLDFFHAGLDNVIHSLNYIKNIVFQSRYQSDWLPFSVNQQLDKFTLLINLCVKLIYVMCFGYFFVIFVKRLPAAWRERKLEAQTIIPIALLFGIFSTSFFMFSKNFYESSLILPLILLFFALLLPDSSAGNTRGWSHSYLFGFILIVSIASQVNLLRTFTSSLTGPWLGGGKLQSRDYRLHRLAMHKCRKISLMLLFNVGSR